MGATTYNTQGVLGSVEHDKCAEEHKVVGGALTRGRPAGVHIGDQLEVWVENRQSGLGSACGEVL